MIYFDVTKMGAAKHRSGLMRVSGRLRDELGEAAVGVSWKNRGWQRVDGKDSIRFSDTDWLLTAELFCEEERPGFWSFLKNKPCRLAAIFHDAIPLKHPHTTWPKSVARHPEYMKMLSCFDRVFPISTASKEDLTGFWAWQAVPSDAVVREISLGADFLKRPRPAFADNSARTKNQAPSLLCVGILEPRKNQLFLLDVCAALWAEGLAFSVNIVGRVNPHFGPPVCAKIAALKKQGRPVFHHQGLSDDGVLALYRTATASVFPTVAEGCGLPPLESLWLGVPCVCSDLPVLRENIDGGGCVPVSVGNVEAWKTTLRSILTKPDRAAQLRVEAERRVVPLWRQTAEALRSALEN